MKPTRIFLFSLLTIFSLTLSLHAQSHWVKSAQFEMGKLLPTDSLVCYMEYPVCRPLPADSIQSLRKQGFEATDCVQFQITQGTSRGKTLVDVNYIPVIVKDGKWQEIVSYDLKYKLVGAQLSRVQRYALNTLAEVSAASRYANHSVLSSGRWVKIRVSKEGIYELTDEWLRNQGFSNPARVKLYGYGGRLLPEIFTFTGDDALIDDLNEVPLYRRSSGGALFFAEGLLRWNSNGKPVPNTFSSYSYYFLTEGDSPATFLTQEAPTGETTQVTTVPARALQEGDGYVWYGGGRDFFNENDTRDTYSFTLSLPGNVDETNIVSYDVSASNSTSASSVAISLQPTGSSTSSVVAQSTISKIEQSEESARGSRGTFTAALGTAPTFSIYTSSTGRFCRLYTKYNQQLSVTNTTGVFTTDNPQAVMLNVAGANSGTRVWQLGTATSSVSELSGSLRGTTYYAQAPSGTARFVIVNVNQTYETPEAVDTIANQDLHADSAYDYVIITPASGIFQSQAEKLAKAHAAKSGLRVKVVRADQLFNEFSSGTPDATAYRRYMKMLYDRATSEEDMPRYLLLFGDCSYDNRMITSDWKGTSPDNYLLAYERNDQEDYSYSYSIGTLHSYVTDDYYGLLDDGEGSKPQSEKVDLGIGRFPCNTTEQADWLVEKAIEYLNDSTSGNWKNQMWAIGDVGDNNLHMEDAEAVTKQVASSAPVSFLLRRIYLDAYDVTQEAKGATYPQATAKLKRAMQQGALIFNYNGHGSPSRISKNFLLDKADFTDNVSKARPLWLFASCEITPYDQASDDIGRSALYAAQSPAVAVICASRSVYANYNRLLNRGLAKYLFGRDADGRRYTMGDALRLTKNELISSTSTIGSDPTINKLKYSILGDPALALVFPEEGIVIDSINGQPVSESSLTQLPIGGKAIFTGYITADSLLDASFSGTLIATAFTPKQNITCKGYGSNSNFTYSDYTQTLFEGTTNVTNGRFKVEFVVPRGITFSTSEALLSLYAASSDGKRELSGNTTKFCFNGTASTAEVDSIGPDIYLYFNTPDFPNGGKVSTSPTLYAALSDSSGISMVSGSMGHDMEIWLDGDPSSTTTVSGYFSFDYGSYQAGLVEYPFSELTTGVHSLTMRAWDVFDNSSTATLAFVVTAGGVSTFDVNAVRTSLSDRTIRFVTTFTDYTDSETDVTTEVYNIYGTRLWHKSTHAASGVGYASLTWDGTNYAGVPLVQGVYLYRSLVNGKETDTKKMIIR